MDETMTKNVFGWDHFFTYLSGPIDFADDKGANWRDEWVEKLVKIGFKREHVLNPCKKPLQHAPFNLDNEQEIMARHKKNREWSKLMDSVNQIMHIDLRLVDLSGLVCANFPKVGRGPLEETINKWAELMELVKDEVPEKTTESLNKIFESLINRCIGQRVPTYGTMHEIVVARQQKKPTFVVWEGEKETCSAWLMKLVGGPDHIFANVDEMIVRLDNISKGKTAYNVKDWLLLNL